MTQGTVCLYKYMHSRKGQPTKSFVFMAVKSVFCFYWNRGRKTSKRETEECLIPLLPLHLTYLDFYLNLLVSLISLSKAKYFDTSIKSYYYYHDYRYCYCYKFHFILNLDLPRNSDVSPSSGSPMTTFPKWLHMRAPRVTSVVRLISRKEDKTLRVRLSLASSSLTVRLSTHAPCKMIGRILVHKIQSC